METLIVLEIKGPIIVAEPFNACSPITMDLHNTIALAIRDKSVENCTFVSKVIHLQKAGAIGVVVMNQKPFRYEGDLLSVMNNATALPEEITIPSIFITYASGSAILSLLNQGISVNATISKEGETIVSTFSFWQYVGTFCLLFVMVYSCFILVSVIMYYAEKLLLRRTMDSPSSIVSGVYGDDHRVIDAENPEECTICLDTLNKGDPIETLPCKHIFHKVCIEEWLKQGKAVCPTCRRGIFDDDEVNWLLEGKARETDRLIGKWEMLYSGSFSYLYGICFFVFVLFSPFIYFLFL